jgi:hypothetical protein
MEASLDFETTANFHTALEDPASSGTPQTSSQRTSTVRRLTIESSFPLPGKRPQTLIE